MAEGFYEPSRGGDYWNVMGDKLVKQVPEGTEGAVSRLNKNEKTVWEIRKGGYEGTIKSVYIQKSNDPKYPDKICIKFTKATIQMPVTGQHAQAFIAKLRNIDISEPIKFEPYRVERTDKKNKFNVGVTIKQGGEKVKNHLDTKKDGDLPNLVQKKKAGKTVWDTTDRDNFLYEHLVEWLEEQDFPDPREKSASDDDEEEEETQVSSDEDSEESDDDQDPPF